MFVRKEITACGLHGKCRLQCVVESDGSVYPCDFYAIDPYCGGSLAEQTLEKSLSSLRDTGFLSSRGELSMVCGSCCYLPVCNGGCKRMFTAVYVEQSTDFCGFRSLLDDIGQDLCEVGLRLLG